MRVGLLECDHVPDRLRPIAGDYADMFDAAFPALDLVRFDAVNGALPDRPDACDAWLCTGSRYSAYDDADWIGGLCQFVRDVAAAAVPFAGVCFGHQVLAQALGGRVEKAASGWGVGAHRTEFAAPPGPSTVLYMHQDQVVALPPGAAVVAAADHCPVAAFEVGPMLGVQAHPEFGREYVDALLAERVERIGAERVAAARAGLAQPLDSAAVAGRIAQFLKERA